MSYRPSHVVCNCYRGVRTLIIRWCLLLTGVAGVLFASSSTTAAQTPPVDVWQKAAARGKLNQEALGRTHRVVKAWLKVINPETGLTPESYDSFIVGCHPDRWTVANSAADLYSSLVMDAAFTDREAMNGVLKRAIETERKHAQRIGRLPDDLYHKTLKFVYPEPSIDRCVFGAAEGGRDGLLRITEILGPGTVWCDRLIELTDEIMAQAQFKTPLGPIPRGDHEVDGEMLQTLSRLHALTGGKKYREWAERIGEYHLFQKPLRRSAKLVLHDHGGEIISGLSELFAMTSHADPAKAQRYRKPLRELLDRVLEVGQADDGSLYCAIDPLNGKVLLHNFNMHWGYTCNAHVTYDMITGENRYREAVERAQRAVPKHYTVGHKDTGAEAAAAAKKPRPKWQPEGYIDRYGRTSDNYADAIENALVLHNRIPVEGIEEWVIHTIPYLWAFQNADGTVNRIYDDSSFGRTSVLFAMFLSKGIRADRWREDIRLGAVTGDDGLYVLLQTDQPWSGRLIFDRARWRLVFHLPMNYPRINELPEWYVVSESADYEVTINNENPRSMLGAELTKGLPIELAASAEARIIVRKR